MLIYSVITVTSVLWAAGAEGRLLWFFKFYLYKKNTKCLEIIIILIFNSNNHNNDQFKVLFIVKSSLYNIIVNYTMFDNPIWGALGNTGEDNIITLKSM